MNHEAHGGMEKEPVSFEEAKDFFLRHLSPLDLDMDKWDHWFKDMNIPEDAITDSEVQAAAKTAVEEVEQILESQKNSEKKYIPEDTAKNIINKIKSYFRLN